MLADSPRLVEVGDARLYWLAGDPAGDSVLVDTASGEVLDGPSFVDIVGEELRISRLSQGGEDYPAVPFPSLEPVTQEQEMHQYQLDPVPPGYTPTSPPRVGNTERCLCGPTSLAMVLDYHGEHIPLWQVADVSTRNHHLPDMADVCGTHFGNLQRAAAFSHTSTDWWEDSTEALDPMEWGDRNGLEEWGYPQRQQGSPTKHYGYVTARANWLAVPDDDVVDLFADQIAKGQPLLLHIKTGVQCPSASTEQSPAACGDGLDNDGDDSIDCADPDCDPGTCPRNAEDDPFECVDGNDTDGDMLVDCADPSCQVPGCPLNYTYTGGHYVVLIGVYDAPPSDPLIILLDPGHDTDFWVRNWNDEEPWCAGAEQVTIGFRHYRAKGHGGLVARPMPILLQLLEDTPSAGRFTLQASVYTAPLRSSTAFSSCNFVRRLNGCLLETENGPCSNGIDDDGDGLTDCSDDSCSYNPAVTVCGPEENSDDECGNGIDDDGDGRTDCNDFGCLGAWFVTGCFARENRQATCTDEVDNDADGLTDCDDLDCRNPFVAACDPFCDGAARDIPVSLYRNGVLVQTKTIPWSAGSSCWLDGTVFWDFPRDGTELGDQFEVVAVGNLYGANAGDPDSWNHYMQDERLWFDQLYGWAALHMDSKRTIFRIGGQGVAALGDEGNLYLRGHLHPNTTVVATGAQEVLFKDPAGGVVAKIDDAGDLYTIGTVHQAMDDVNDTTSGGSSEQAILDAPPTADPDANRPVPQALRIVNGASAPTHTVVRLDRYGNIMLRGILLEGYPWL